MKIDLNDPQLTAYALGELHGPEAEEMRNQIAKDPEAQRYVEEIQATAQLISDGLAQEPTESLAPEQRSKLLRTEPKKWFQKSQWIVGLSTLATASLAVVLGLQFHRLTEESPPNLNTELAQPLAVEEPESIPKNIPDAYVFEKDTKAPTGKSTDSKIPDAYTFNEGAIGMPSPDPAATIRSKKFTSSRQGGAEKVGDAAKRELYHGKDVSKVGLLSAFGSGGVRKQLEPAASSSGELMGLTGRSAGISGKRIEALGTKERGSGMDFIDQRRAFPQTAQSEKYSQYEENEILKVKETPLSTFSIDVDTASYSNVRRMLIDSQWPHKDAVRLEEMVNYFNYDYTPPTDSKPFATHVEIARTPWNEKSRLVRIALKGKEVPARNRPATNLVFLIDVSGSMLETNKLPLVQKSLHMLVDQMRSADRVALVVYAGSTGLVLDSTSGKEKEVIRKAIDSMVAGGSTNGGAGIELAYSVASKNFIKDGINRVILATDGDFNVGVTNESDLIGLIEKKAKSGVFLTVLGVGMGNLKDNNLQKLADKGNGNYAYIDTLREARKALVEQAGGTLMTIAKDVKIQVEFNPQFVSEYRLVGYEKRKLNAEDFNDDTKDAGEIGAGHTVTAFYEVFSTEGSGSSKVDPLKYQAPSEAKTNDSNEILTVKLRYKAPTGDKSELIEIPVANSDQKFESASSDFQFAAAVADFAQVLKDSKHKGNGSFDQVLELTKDHLNLKGHEDPYRKEFVELVKKARHMKKITSTPSGQ